MDNLVTEAACNEQPTELFFEDDWFKAHIAYSVALPKAREFCDGCPVRVACLAMEADAEHGNADHHRAGIFAGMTPHQRYSLETRGVGLSCPTCDDKYDPVLLRKGDLSCSCGPKHMPPIPDRGDQWMLRHTDLAHNTIAWLVENIEPDCEAPTADKLARKMDVRVKDLRRVYQALLDDQLLELVNGKLVRRADATAARGWVPPHLRVSI
jgi:hypothetical protein